MQTLKQYRNSIWRIPLISLIAGFLYRSLFVRIVLRFGVIEPGVLDERVTLGTSALLLVATLVIGWFLLLRHQTRREIFVSASVVVVYGLLLFLIQLATGSTTGPAAVAFIYLGQPLEWMLFPSSLGLYVQNHFDFQIPLIGWLHFFVPYLWVLFGRRSA